MPPGPNRVLQKPKKELVLMKAIIISDVHYEKDRESYNGRDDGLANILLLRAVHRINSYIKPDIVCLLGDFVNNGELEYLEEIYDIIKLA